MSRKKAGSGLIFRFFAFDDSKEFINANGEAV